MVAVLLPIVEDPPHHCHHDQYKKQGAGFHSEEKSDAGRFYPKPQSFHGRIEERMHQPVSGQDRQEDGAQIAHCTEHDGKEHDRQEGTHQTDQLPHDPDAAAPAGRRFPGCPCTHGFTIHFSAHTAASFPYCSSSI